MSDLGETRDFQAWKKKLEKLLDEAEKLPDGGDLEARCALADSFVEFIIDSSPNTPQMLSLDRIADQARRAVLMSAIDDRMKSLDNRRQDLLLLTKEVAVATEAARDAASLLRLKRAREVVTSLTHSISSIKHFRDALKEGEGATLVQSLDNLVESLKQTRDTIENET